MANPPSRPSGGMHVLTQEDLSSQGNDSGSGTFSTQGGKKTVSSVRVEPILSRRGRMKSPASSSPANRQRNVSATDSEGSESFQDIKEQGHDSGSPDNVDYNSESDASYGSLSDSEASATVVDDPEESMSGDTNNGFQTSVDTETVGLSNQRNTGASGIDSPDEGFVEGDGLYNPMASDSGDQRNGIRAPAYHETSPQAQPVSGEIVPPNANYPVPVGSQTGDATITIGNTGAGNDAAINGDETITIEGGGTVNKGKFLKALKAVANWFMGLFDNKIVVGLAVFFALTFLFGLLASPAGAPLVFVLMTGLSAAITCGFMGLLIADMAPDLGQQPQPQPQPQPQTGNSQNPNQQNNNRSDISSSDIARTQSGSGSSQSSADSADENDTAGSFFMKPNGNKTPASVNNGSGSSSVRDSEDASAAGKVDSQLEKVFGTEAFDKWLNENLLSWANNETFAEYSKAFRSRDDYEDLAHNNKLDGLLKDLHNESAELSFLANLPLAERDSSGVHQSERLGHFSSSFDKALELLDPSLDHCQTMFYQLIRALPKEEFPFVSSNLYSPLLSIGEGRKSLEGLSPEEIAKVEVSDMLRLALQGMDRYVKQRQRGQQEESEEQEKLLRKLGRVDPKVRVQELPTKERVHGFLTNPKSDANIETKENSVQTDGSDVNIETKENSVQTDGSDATIETKENSAPIDEKEVQEGSSSKTPRKPEEQNKTKVRHQKVLAKFKHSLDYYLSKFKIPEATQKNVLFRAFFEDIQIAVKRRYQESEGFIASRKTEGVKDNLTEERLRMLVVAELGKKVFEIGKDLMKDDNAERSKKEQQGKDLAKIINIEARDGKKIFLDKIFQSDDVRALCGEMEITDNELDKAKNYFIEYIK